MREARKKLLILFILFITGAAVSAAALRIILNRHDPSFTTVKTVSYWSRYLDLPVRQRIVWETPQRLSEFLLEENKRDGFNATPKDWLVTQGERATIQSALDGIPEVVWAKASTYLAGIAFVEGLGSTGFTDYVYDLHGRPKYAFIVIDRSVLKRRANEWATWKEDSPFSPGNSGRHVNVAIADEKSDGPTGAFQFIVLHELGHVLSLAPETHPPWQKKIEGASMSPLDYSFSALTWTHDAGTGVVKSLFDEVFPLRHELKFYRNDGSGIPRSMASEVYGQLSKTSFVSLYGSTSPADDFAEALALYVHTVLLKKPYEITVDEGKKKRVLFSGCFEDVRCHAKREFFEKFLAL